jgi:hypothetical protein
LYFIRKISLSPALEIGQNPKSISLLEKYPVPYTLPELSTKIEVLPQILSYEEKCRCQLGIS